MVLIVSNLILFLFILLVTNCHAYNDNDEIGLAVNKEIGKFKFPEEKDVTLDRQFATPKEWFDDFVERFDAFLARIPKQKTKDKVQARMVLLARQWAGEFKSQHVDTVGAYLAQGSPAADNFMKNLEIRLNFLARPRFLVTWATIKCGTKIVWWYCGEIVD